MSTEQIYYEGNVGIGTRNPSQPLQVAGNVSVGHAWDGGSTTTGIKIGKPDKQGQWQAGAAFLQFQDSSSAGPNRGTSIALHTHEWGAGTKEVLRVTANGNIGIGTANPSEKLEVSGAIKCTSLTQTSDGRLKKAIAPIANALEKIMTLKGVTYQWKDTAMGTKTEAGLVAQEVEAILPEVVSTDKEGSKSIAYGKLVAPLIEAVKEQQKQIETLQKQVAQFKTA